MNLKLAQKTLDQIKLHGVSEICLAPGGRNSPFVLLLEESVTFKTYYFFEERSAAFFALGRIKSIDSPVAIITTSGTAAAELLPAAIEAYYGGAGLVLVTADRPKSYRGTGAPQSIEQVGLYSKYVEKVYDWDALEEVNISSWSRQMPIHLNVCFDEPLLASLQGEI